MWQWDISRLTPSIYQFKKNITNTIAFIRNCFYITIYFDKDTVDD